MMTPRSVVLIGKSALLGCSATAMNKKVASSSSCNTLSCSFVSPVKLVPVALGPALGNFEQVRFHPKLHFGFFGSPLTRYLDVAP